jgi:hypothetical protein
MAPRIYPDRFGPDPFKDGRFDELFAESQRCLIGFLNVEIQLGFTFAETAAFERAAGNRERSQHTKGEAEKAAQTIRRFLDRVSGQEIRAAIAQRCAELERALAALEI